MFFGGRKSLVCFPATTLLPLIYQNPDTFDQPTAEETGNKGVVGPSTHTHITNTHGGKLSPQLYRSRHFEPRCNMTLH